MTPRVRFLSLVENCPLVYLIPFVPFLWWLSSTLTFLRLIGAYENIGSAVQNYFSSNEYELVSRSKLF